MVTAAYTKILGLNAGSGLVNYFVQFLNQGMTDEQIVSMI